MPTAIEQRPTFYEGVIRGLVVDAVGDVAPVETRVVVEFDGDGRLCHCGRVIEPGDSILSGAIVIAVHYLVGGVLVHHESEAIGVQAQFIIPGPDDTVRVVVLGRRADCELKMEGLLNRFPA